MRMSDKMTRFLYGVDDILDETSIRTLITLEQPEVDSMKYKEIREMIQKLHCSDAQERLFAQLDIHNENLGE